MADIFEVARLDQYLDWLTIYSGAGHLPTHCYDYPWENSRFLVARKNFRLDGECGSAARPILVPKGVGVDGALGYNSLFHMDKSILYRGVALWIPVYNNPAFDSLPGVKELREEEARRARARQTEERMERAQEENSPSDLRRFLKKGGW